MMKRNDVVLLFIGVILGSLIPDLVTMSDSVNDGRTHLVAVSILTVVLTGCYLYWKAE